MEWSAVFIYTQLAINAHYISNIKFTVTYIDSFMAILANFLDKLNDWLYVHVSEPYDTVECIIKSPI